MVKIKIFKYVINSSICVYWERSSVKCVFLIYGIWVSVIVYWFLVFVFNSRNCRRVNCIFVVNFICDVDYISYISVSSKCFGYY